MFLLSGMSVNISCLIFGVYNGLILIKSIISGNSIADGNSDQVIGNTLESKQLKGNENRGNGTVGNAAEQGGHSGSGAQRHYSGAV